MNTSLPRLELLEGTDLRVGPNMLRYVLEQRKRSPDGSVTVLATDAKTGLPIRAQVNLSHLAAAPALGR